MQQTYQKFWKGFNRVSQDNEEFCKAFTVLPFPSIRPYQDYAIGKPYHISVGVQFNRHETRVAAYFSDLGAYRFYSKFKEQIERNAGKNIIWKCHQTKASATLYHIAYFDENHGWDDTYQIMMADMLLMKKAFEWVQP